MLHVADGINVDNEADASDHQHHDERELVKIDSKFRRERARAQPGAIALDMGNLIGRQASELRRDPKRIGKRRRRAAQRQGVDQRPGKAFAQQSVDGGSRQRQQWNDPQVHIVCSRGPRRPFPARMGRLYNFSKFTRSTLSVSRVRNTAMIMAKPTAASAAATTITKNTKMCPSSDFSWAANATNVRFTPFSISSIERKIVMILRLIRNPVTPQPNRIALKIR